MHTGTLVVSLKRDSAVAEHLAEELVHGIGMESRSIRLYEERTLRSFYSGNRHPVSVRYVLLKHIAESLADGDDTLRSVLGLSEVDVSLLKVHIFIDHGQCLRDAGTCSVEHSQQGRHSHEGTPHPHVVKAVCVTGGEDVRYLRLREDVGRKVRLRIHGQLGYEARAAPS